MDAISEPEVIPGHNIANYQQQAMDRVHDYLIAGWAGSGIQPPFNLYIVWFCKVLKDWKALVACSLVDGKYYEVTYNGEWDETYIDEYGKINNVCIRGKYGVAVVTPASS